MSRRSISVLALLLCAQASAQILQPVQMSRGLSLSGLVAYYDFIQGADPQVLYDRSGNGYHAQRGATVDTTTADLADYQWGWPGGRFSTYGTGDYAVLSPLPAAMQNNSYTIYVVFTFGATGATLVQLGDGAVAYGARIRIAASIVDGLTTTSGTGGGQKTVTGRTTLVNALRQPTPAYVAALRMDAGAKLLSLFLNGQKDAADTATGTATVNYGTTKSMYIGSASGVAGYHAGYISGLAIYSGAHSDAEVARHSGILLRQHLARTSLGYTVFDGDSMTIGDSWDDENTRYPQTTVSLLNAPPYYLRCSWINLGVGGQALTDMEADAATEVDPLRGTKGPLDILIVWGGHNDMALLSKGRVDGLTAYARLVTYLTSRRAAGWRKIVVLTILPSTSYGPEFEDKRQAMNTLIRENLATDCPECVLADIAADPRIGAPGAHLDLTYYLPDECHMTGTGYAVVASIVAPKVIELALAP